MKKVLLLLVVLSGVAISSFAQTGDKGKFNIGLEGGLPLGAAGDVYNAVIGASFKYEHPIAENTALTGSVGYNAFLTKSAYKSIIGSSNGAIPVKAGIKYGFGQGFFGEGQLGVAFSTESGGGTAFVYAPGIGYDFGGGVDVGVRYEGWSNNGTTSQLGLRLGFSF